MGARLAALSVVVALAACGGERDEERGGLKPEETVFGDLVTAPGKVGDRADAAVEMHREALEEQLRDSEGGRRDE